MKKALSVILAACILCVSASCAAKRNTVDPSGSGNPSVGTSVSGDNADNGSNIPSVSGESPSVDGTENQPATTAPEEKFTLENVGGWWKHVGGSLYDYIPFVDGFFIDAENGTWTEYSQNGIRGGTYSCYVDEMGIHLDYGEVGVTILTFDGVSLLNSMGIIEYIPGEPVVEVVPSAYDGNWYLLGDKTAEHIVIFGESIKMFGQVSSEGTYTSEDVTTTLESGNTVEETRIKSSFGLELVVAETGDVLYDPANNKAYIREDKIDTPEGEDFIKKYDLICHEWKAEGEGMPTIVFEYYENKFYLINEVPLDGETQILKDIGGTWGIHEYELSLYFSDGTNEITPYDPATIMISTYSHMKINKVTK